MRTMHSTRRRFVAFCAVAAVAVVACGGSASPATTPASRAVPLALYRLTGFDDLGGVFELLGALEPAGVGPQGWGYHDFVVPDLDPIDTYTADYCIVAATELAEPYCQPGVAAVFDLVR